MSRPSTQCRRKKHRNQEYLWANLATRYYTHKDNYMDWKIQNIIHERRLKEGLPQFQFKSESTYQKVFVPIDMSCRGQKYPKVYG